MRLDDFDKVSELTRQLKAARAALDAFRAGEEVVRVWAKTPAAHFLGLAYPHEVELLPVPQSVVVSAAERRVHKLESELRQLGVEV